MARHKRPRIGLDRALVTPEGVTLRLRLASSGARAGAFIIDALVMLGILLGVTLALFAFHAGLGDAFGSLMLIVWMLGFFALRNFYFVLAESGTRAATVGKRVMRLRVIARDGGRLTGGAIVARNLMREIEIFLPLVFTAYSASEGIGDRWTGAIGLLWAAIFLFFPAFNRDRLRAGDVVAGTWVIEAERRRIGADLLAAAAPAATAVPFSAAELDAYGQYELHKLEEVLRRADRDSITTVAATIRQKIGRHDIPDDRAFLDAYYAGVRLHLERKLLFGQRKKDKFDAAA